MIRRRTYDDGVLAVYEVELHRRIEQIAHGHQDLVGVVLLRNVGQVKRLHGLIVQIRALVARILGDKDCIGRDRLPERSTQRLHDPQGVVKRHTVQVDLDALGGVLRIKDHVQTRQFADGLIDHLGVFYHVQRDWVVRNRLKLHRRCQRGDLLLHGALPGHALIHTRYQHLTGQCSMFCCCCRTRGGGSSRRPLRNLQLLRCCLIARIDLERSRKLVDGARCVTGLPQDPAAIHVQVRRCVPHALVASAVTQICRLLQMRLTVCLKGDIVVLPRLGILPTLVPGGCRLCPGCRV